MCIQRLVTWHAVLADNPVPIPLYLRVVLLQITTVDEAKAFYPLFGLGANVALIFSGRAVKYFSQVNACHACMQT